MEILEEDWGDFKFDSTCKIEKGVLLVSNPFSSDENFRRSVVFLVDHDDHHSIGFILNKPINVCLSDLSVEFVHFPASIHFGGPVQLDSLHFIHRIPPFILQDSVEIIDGIYWGGDIEQLKELVLNDKVNLDDIRFLIGYSGWATKQLETEFEQNSWIVLESSEDKIFLSNAEMLWRDCLKGVSQRHDFIANLPENPRYN